MFSPLEQFDILIMKCMKVFMYDLSMSSIIMPFILLNMFLSLFVFLSKKKLKLVPEAWQFMMEKIYAFIFSIMKQQMGFKGYVYLPLIFTLFMFVLFCNIMSLVPFGMALTSHLILILFLSMSMCISMFCMGILSQNFNFFKNFMPECPLVLMPMLMPMEMFSYLIRMFSLSMSLAANMLAGHTLVYIISGFIIKLSSLKMWFYVVVVVPLLGILLLELGVAFLQAYVFAILVCIYLSDTLKTAGH